VIVGGEKDAMKISSFLGQPVSRLLGTAPFNGWPVERSVDEDLDLIHYVFPEHMMELRCDNDERVSVIFLSPDECDLPDVLSEIPFRWTREQVQRHFGRPAKSGPRRTDPILGEYGAWDRFAQPAYAVHIEYQVDVDAIRRVTLMRNDVVP
jgi:hypothetical protein